MATTPKVVSPPARLDAQGRLSPFTDEEKAQHASALREVAAALAAIPDDPNEDDAEFFRAFDESHPDRPAFTGMY